MDDVRKLDHYELEILDFEEKDRVEKSGMHRAKMYMLFGRDSRFRDISLTVEYRGSLVMWNDWNGVSWFEDLKCQQDKKDICCDQQIFSERKCDGCHR